MDTKRRYRSTTVIDKPIIMCQSNINGLSLQSSIALSKFCSDQGINILALQETKLTDLQIRNMDNIVNMETFMIPKDDDNLGVGLCISTSLAPQRIVELEEQGLDIIWCSVKINSYTAIIASAYSKPTNDTKSLEKLIKNINAAEEYRTRNNIKNILVFGDFNSRNITWGDTITNKRGRVLLDYIYKSDFMLCTPADKTFVAPNNGGSVIDLLIAHGKIVDHIERNWIERNTELFSGAPIRGHYPVLYSLDIGKAPQEKMAYNDYRKTDWELWSNQIEEELQNVQADYNHGHSLDELKARTKTLNEAIIIANDIIPQKIISKHSKPFWTRALTACEKELKTLLINARKRATPRNLELLKVKKEEFKTLLISEKNDWIMAKLSNLNTSDTNLFWKRYKQLFGERQSNFIGNLSKEGVLYTKDADKENILYKEFFSGKHLQGSKFDEHFKFEILQEYNNLCNENLHQNESSDKNIRELLQRKGINQKTHNENENEDPLNTVVTLEEITEAISNQETEGKCTDGYYVNPIMLKHLGPTAKLHFKKICNLSLQLGHWCWEKSDVCFIKKANKDSYLDPGSYRPICISAYVGKILEKILERRLRNYCVYNRILDTPQEGFCPNKSTTRYLYKLMTNLHSAKQKKLAAMILLIDFEKAFDSVWIPGLVLKLYNYGIKGNFLKLVNSFLVSRSIRLKINGTYGPFHRSCNMIGLPQGSVLSPLLFIIYISEMLSNIHECNPTKTDVEAKAYKFADDGSVSVICNNTEECQKALQNICNLLEKWCKAWRLNINCNRNKTEVIIINDRREDSSRVLPKIKIGDKELRYVEKSKVLGVTIDKDLTFVHHARNVLSQCWNQWYKISKNTSRLHGLNTASLSLLFKTMVMSKLLYAAPVWLDKQAHIFKDLWARVLLKLSGSEYHTERSITELMLNIPSLEIHYDVITTKFLLKCMSSEDDMIATILHIEQNEKHASHRHIQELKKFLLWKKAKIAKENDSIALQSRRNTIRSQGVHLIDYMHHKDCYYTKHEIEEYRNFIWQQKLLNKFPEHKIEAWEELNFKLFFPRGSTRLQNTHTSEFIHGHSLRFANFRKTLRLDNSDICKYCNNQVDSTEHQLFECTVFDCPERTELLQLMENNIADFSIKLLTSTIYQQSKRVIKLFLKLVTHITTTDLSENTDPVYSPNNSV